MAGWFVMITDFSFGKIVCGGKIYSNDIKIINGQVIADWWRKSGHRVDIEDISDILEAKPDILVIGKGSPGLMRSTASLRAYLTANNIELFEEKSSRAIRLFNRFYRETKRVAAGIHVGC